MDTFRAGLVVLFVSFLFVVTLSAFTLLLILSFAILSLLMPFRF
jgi:hypothetical protein